MPFSLSLRKGESLKRHPAVGWYDLEHTPYLSRAPRPNGLSLVLLAGSELRRTPLSRSSPEDRLNPQFLAYYAILPMRDWLLSASGKRPKGAALPSFSER